MAQSNNGHGKMSEAVVPPVINDEKLPLMETSEELSGERLSITAKNEMQDSLDVKKAKFKQTGNFMESFEQPDRPKVKKPDCETDDSVEPLEDQRLRKEDEQTVGHVILRFHAKQSAIQIVGVRLVEGPLLQESSARGELGFEMRLKEQRLALGSIIDVGVIRGYAPPYPTEDMEGHHFEEQLEYDFVVRVAKEYFTHDYVNLMELSVFRIKGDVDFKCLSSAKPVLEQSDNLRCVARVPTLSGKYIERKALAELNKILMK